MTPAIDVRAIAEGTTFVTSGRNYAFDSKGPKSAFASRLLNAGNPIEIFTGLFSAHSLGGFVFTPTKIGRFTSGGIFVTNHTFASPLVGNFIHRKWTRAVFGTAVYYCHPGTGILKFDTVTAVWSTFDPGISSPIAIIESNGRMVVLGSLQVAWSSPSDPEDFTPSLGGAGAQTINERIAGTPFTLIALASGYMLWTEQGALAGEYIGGDTVFRHYVVEHQHIPLNSDSIVRMPDGSYIMCTIQGLFLHPFSGIPSPLTPVFNEFLRSEILPNNAGGFDIHLEYNALEDRLYLQIRDWQNWYNRTYVLSVSLDKWGEFSEPHHGILQISVDSEPFDSVSGYVDITGRVHRFMPFGTNRETDVGVFTGLDSEIVLGPFRSPALQPQADAMQELQGFVLSNKARPSWAVPTEEDLDTEPDSEEDLQALPDSTEDEGSHNLGLPPYTYGVIVTGDLSGFDEIDDVDPDSENSNVITEVPELVRESGHTRYYTCLVPGVWHRLHVSATEVDEYFHVTFGELTLSYSGRLTP